MAIRKNFHREKGERKGEKNDVSAWKESYFSNGLIFPFTEKRELTVIE